MIGRAKETLRAAFPRRLWARASGIRTRRAVARFPRRVVEHSYGGHRLRVLLADALAEGWYDHDWPELPELSLFKGRTLRPGALVFDLGAHQAVVALALEREVRPGGTVVAVEMNEHNARIAAENVRLNEPAAVVVVSAAVSERAGLGRADWRLNAALSPRASGATLVELVTVDDLARTYGYPDLVYVDVEGFECHALRGATETLAHGSDVFVEVHAYGALQDAGGSVEELLTCLQGRRLLAMFEGDAGFSPLPAALPRARFFVAALS